MVELIAIAVLLLLMVLSERVLGFLWSDGATTPRWYCAECDLRYTSAEVAAGWNARTCRRGHPVQRLRESSVSNAALLLGFGALLAVFTIVLVRGGSGL